MQKSVEKWQKNKTAWKNTQSLTNLAITRGLLLNHQLNHLQDTFLCLWRQRVKFLGKFRRLVARRVIQNVTKDRVSRNLKSVEKDNQLLAAREWHTAFNRGNIICCQPCLFRKLFLRKTEPFSALLYSFSYSLVNHSAYLHLFYNAHDNYMD